MKTSNKILLSFAAALILIPILCIAFVSRVYFEPGDYTSRMGASDTYGAIPKQNVPITGSGSSESINIEGDTRIHLVIAITPGKALEVKTTDNLKGLISVEFNSSGQLQIKVANRSNRLENYGRIAITAPGLKEITVNGSRGINLQTEMDSLKLSLTNTELAQFDAATNVKYLSVTTNNVKDITFREGNPLSTVLNLNNTNVKAELTSFDNLAINARGTSTIELNGGEDGNPVRSIKNLKINTMGKTDFKVHNMEIAQCSGRFSDSTSVQMPAINLNQMYKVKK
jgi:hypothetical protein